MNDSVGTTEISDDAGNTIKIVYAPHGVEAETCLGTHAHISINGHDVKLASLAKLLELGRFLSRAAGGAEYEVPSANG